MRVRVLHYDCDHESFVDTAESHAYCVIHPESTIYVIASMDALRGLFGERPFDFHELCCTFTQCKERNDEICASRNVDNRDSYYFPMHVVETPEKKGNIPFFIVHPDERDRMHRYLHPPTISPSEQALIDIASALKNSIELGFDREYAENDFNKRTRN